jgi:hypothetical protein
LTEAVAPDAGPRSSRSAVVSRDESDDQDGVDILKAVLNGLPGGDR